MEDKDEFCDYWTCDHCNAYIACAGWPAYHQSTVHSSALMYDIDKDGIREVVLATFNGEVLFFRYMQL